METDRGRTSCWSCLIGEVEKVPRQADLEEKGGTSLDSLARETTGIAEQPFKLLEKQTDLRWFGDLHVIGCLMRDVASPFLSSHVFSLLLPHSIQSLAKFDSGTWKRCSFRDKWRKQYLIAIKGLTLVSSRYESKCSLHLYSLCLPLNTTGGEFILFAV